MSQRRKKKGREQRRQTELTATVRPVVAVNDTAPTVVTNTSNKTQASSNPAPIIASVTTADAQLMRRDLVKVAIVVIIVIGILVALMYTNRSTGWLDRIAGELYRWLKLG